MTPIVEGQPASYSTAARRWRAVFFACFALIALSPFLPWLEMSTEHKSFFVATHGWVLPVLEIIVAASGAVVLARYPANMRSVALVVAASTSAVNGIGVCVAGVMFWHNHNAYWGGGLFISLIPLYGLMLAGVAVLVLLVGAKSRWRLHAKLTLVPGGVVGLPDPLPNYDNEPGELECMTPLPPFSSTVRGQEDPPAR